MGLTNNHCCVHHNLSTLVVHIKRVYNGLHSYFCIFYSPRVWKALGGQQELGDPQVRVSLDLRFVRSDLCFNTAMIQHLSVCTLTGHFYGLLCIV